jgi:hypothetical protein
MQNKMRQAWLSASLAAPQGLEPRQTDPKSGVLPLDEGAMAEKSLSELRGYVKGKE